MLPGYEITISTPVFSPGVPFDELENSFVRVVFVLVGLESFCKLLCTAYQHGLSFPTYQLVFLHVYPECFVEDKLEFDLIGKHYTCSVNDVRSTG